MPTQPTDDAAECKYRAFLSYSHKDMAWGQWLHKALESYRVPRRLVGIVGREGEVPARIYPVFRDEAELPTASDLNDAVDTALAQSRYLIVICSPHAAMSLWVNQEVIKFKRLGRESRILCLIVDGEPNAGDKPQMGSVECFPEATRFKVDAAGKVTGVRVEPLAADARPGDATAKRYAFLKLAAGVLGIGYDQIVRRDTQRRRRNRIVWTTLLAALIAVVGFIVIGERMRADRATFVAQEQAFRRDALRKKAPFSKLPDEYGEAEIAKFRSQRAGAFEIARILKLRTDAGLTSPHMYERAASEVAMHDAQIAWAGGDLDASMMSLLRAERHAEAHAHGVRLRFEAGATRVEDLQPAVSNHEEAKAAIAQLESFVRDLKSGDAELLGLAALSVPPVAEGEFVPTPAPLPAPKLEEVPPLPMLEELPPAPKLVPPEPPGARRALRMPTDHSENE